jgi:predicted alpha/beta superfamily hydrolase
MWWLGLLAAATAARGAEFDITFHVTAEGVGPTDQVYIVGNAKALGAWDPAAVPMTRAEDGTWTTTLRARKGEMLEYKITRGSWASEALDEKLRIKPNRRIEVEESTTVEIAVPGWRDTTTPADAVVGEVIFHRDVAGEGLVPRDVAVWLPPGYSENADTRFPVLYMHDGQNLYDPALAGFGMEWQMDEEITRLVGEGKIGPVIVVGMYCTKDRVQEYGDTDLGETYRRFVVETVKPMIDRTYRTLPDREHTAVMGSSMGGCVSFLLVWEYPDVFAQAGCLSPSFSEPTFKRVKGYKGPPRPIRIYMDNGTVGLEQRLQKGIDRMLPLLKSQGYVEGVNFHWFLDKGAEHNELAWALRVHRPLEFMFGTK